MFTTTLFSLLLPAFAAAQGYGNPDPVTTSSAAAPVPSAPADTTGQMNIDVAFNSTFTFHPNNIMAPNGTLVTFWIPNNGLDHSVTQSSFDAPCTYLASAPNSSAVGFDSGLQHSVKFTINITDDTKPIWFHCKQLLHCGMGMVGSINAPSTGNNTFQNFMAAAMKVGGSETTEPDKGPVMGGVNGIASAPPASTTGGAASQPAGKSGAIQLSVSAGLVMLASALFLARV